MKSRDQRQATLKFTKSTPNFYFARRRGETYYDQHVCMSVSRWTCLSARISQNHKSKLNEIFCACYLWPWLGPPLTTKQ